MDEKVYYLAGPMTGYPDWNFPAFEAAAKDLRAQGYNVKSPHEIDFGETKETRGRLPYNYYLKGSFKMLLECDEIVFLPGWKLSSGARREKDLAVWCGMGTWLYDPSTPRGMRLVIGL